jgi:hypothetical protein
MTFMDGTFMTRVVTPLAGLPNYQDLGVPTEIYANTRQRSHGPMGATLQALLVQKVITDLEQAVSTGQPVLWH